MTTTNRASARFAHHLGDSRLRRHHYPWQPFLVMLLATLQMACGSGGPSYSFDTKEFRIFAEDSRILGGVDLSKLRTSKLYGGLAPLIESQLATRLGGLESCKKLVTDLGRVRFATRSELRSIVTGGVSGIFDSTLMELGGIDSKTVVGCAKASQALGTPVERDGGVELVQPEGGAAFVWLPSGAAFGGPGQKLEGVKARAEAKSGVDGTADAMAAVQGANPAAGVWLALVPGPGDADLGIRYGYMGMEVTDVLEITIGVEFVDKRVAKDFGAKSRTAQSSAKIEASCREKKAAAAGADISTCRKDLDTFLALLVPSAQVRDILVDAMAAAKIDYAKTRAEGTFRFSAEQVLSLGVAIQMGSSSDAAPTEGTPTEAAPTKAAPAKGARPSAPAKAGGR